MLSRAERSARCGDPLVGIAHGFAQPLDEVTSADHDLHSELHESLVPDVEGGELLGRRARGTCRLQQGVALTQHPVVVGEDPREAGRFLNEQFVEEAAAPRGLTPDQGEILGGEDHRGDVARKLARLDRSPIDLRAVGADPVQLHLDEDIPIAMLETSSHDRRVTAEADERLIAGDAV